MSAIRLARGVTGRDAHPQVRRLLPRALGWAAGRCGQWCGDARHPGFAGRAAADDGTHRAGTVQRSRMPWRPRSSAGPDEIACVIVEPVAGNMGCVPPQPGFLPGLRRLCDEYGALLIFDEVMTGFRVAHGGAQRLYRVKPDLTCLGKVVGGGLPAAAYGGRNDLMRRIAPDGDIYQAGTLSGNPLAMAAGLATLELLERAGGVRSPRRTGSRSGHWIVGPGRRGRCRVQLDVRGRNVRLLLPPRPGHVVRRREAEPCRAIQALLRGHARGRHLSGAVGLRGRFRLARPPTQGHRSNPGSRPQCVVAEWSSPLSRPRESAMLRADLAGHAHIRVRRHS